MFLGSFSFQWVPQLKPRFIVFTLILLKMSEIILAQLENTMEEVKLEDQQTFDFDLPVHRNHQITARRIFQFTKMTAFRPHEPLTQLVPSFNFDKLQTTPIFEGGPCR